MSVSYTHLHDFGLDPDKPPANAIALLPPKRGLTDEQWADIAYCLRVLTDYLDLLHDWRERYKPATPEEPHDPRFEEALHTTETIEHLTDCVAFGTPQQKADATRELAQQIDQQFQGFSYYLPISTFPDTGVVFP